MTETMIPAIAISEIVIRVLACDLRHMERQKNPGQHSDGNGHAVISDLNAEDGKALSRPVEVDAQSVEN